MGIPENIDALLVKHDITADSLARIAGVTPASVSRWRKQGAVPRGTALDKIVEFFGIEKDDILSTRYGLAAKEHGRFPAIGTKSSDTYAPVLGCIHAGDSCEAIQDKREDLWVPPVALEHNSDVYYLEVKGDSMNKVLPEGSMALVDKSAHVDDGDIAVVFVNGDDATIKRVFFAGDTFVLHPESTNPEHLDVAINQRVPGAPDVRIDGKVVWYYPKFGKL